MKEGIKILKEISDKEVNGKEFDVYSKKYKFRKAARAILLDNDKKLALLNVAKRDFHKLPGGGIKFSETVEAGLERELKEETGCDSQILQKLGAILEYREFPKEDLGLIHLSYGFVCRVVGEIGKPSFTHKELRNGFRVEWATLDQALKIFKHKDKPKDYTAKFISLRDLTFVNEYKKFSYSGLDLY